MCVEKLILAGMTVLNILKDFENASHRLSHLLTKDERELNSIAYQCLTSFFFVPKKNHGCYLIKGIEITAFIKQGSRGRRFQKTHSTAK